MFEISEQSMATLIIRKTVLINVLIYNIGGKAMPLVFQKCE
jgi:hypothetical protein